MNFKSSLNRSNTWNIAGTQMCIHDVGKSGRRQKLVGSPTIHFFRGVKRVSGAGHE